MTNTYLVDDWECKSCGFEIVKILCNGELAKTPPYKEYDTWVYCSNKLCVNHFGEGYSQHDPKLVINKKE